VWAAMPSAFVRTSSPSDMGGGNATTSLEVRQVLSEPGGGARGAVLHVRPVWGPDVRVHEVRPDRAGAKAARRPHVRDLQPARGDAR
jgi:hypothetical protein